MQCICKNSTDYKEYRDDEDRVDDHVDDHDEGLLGVVCTSCGQEWLKHEYLNRPGTRRIIFGNQDLEQQDNPPQEVQTEFQVKGSRTQIERADYGRLKPGDHISWRRPYGIWHHSIVVGTDISQENVKVIHWQEVKGQGMQVIEEWLSLDNQIGDLFRMDYPVEIENKNPPKLVLARVKYRLDKRDYGLLENNCEALSAFCKTGVSESFQVKWLWQKLRDITKTVVGNLTKSGTKTVCRYIEETIKSGVRKTLGATAKVTLKKAAASTGQVGLAEAIESAGHASNWVGAVIVIAIEGGMCIWDIGKMDERRNNGQISRKDFIASVSQRLTEAVMGAGLAIGGSLLGEVFGGAAGAALGSVVPVIGTTIGAAVGVFIGSIVGGIFGSLAGKVVGSLIGPYVGKGMVYFIKRDDRAVAGIEELHIGDHIVYYGSWLHPRHHAIVVSIDPGSQKVKVVHKLYSKGIVEEWVNFVKPVYKVIYTEQDAYTSETVVERARSRIGIEYYSILTNNCKDFARLCKERPHR